MRRRTYTDQDKAAGLLALTLTDGNVKRAARDSGISETPIRRWKQEWEREVVPPAIQEHAAQEAGDFIEDADRVRHKALALIEKRIDAQEGKIAELTTVVGVLDDKITRAKGLATTRTEVVHALPSADEIRDALAAGLRGALDAARERYEVIDAEVVEEPAKALPAPERR